MDAFHAGIKSPKEIDLLLARVRKANCNAVFAQVRKRGDAYYASRYEPRAPELPARFDPLRTLIEKARQSRPRIAVYAWVNAAAVGTSSDPRHVLTRHPEYRSLSDTGEGDDKEVVKIDPGVPGAQEWTARVVRDVVRGYGVDGVCLDYIRYGGAHWGYAPASVARFNVRYGREGAPAFDAPLWQQWRRDQVTQLVRRVYADSVAIRPGIVVAAATIAWGNGPRTEDDWIRTPAYSTVYQDWRAWLEEGILDLANPMTYFRADRHLAFNDAWVEWIKEHGYGRAVTVAVANYLNTMPETLDLIGRSRAPNVAGRTASGTLLFSYFGTAVTVKPDASRVPDHDNPAFYDTVAAAFPGRAALPIPEWKTRPLTGHIAGTVLSGSRLEWADGAQVSLTGNGVERRQTAGATGSYAFIDLTPGRYTVTVRHGSDVRTATATVVPGRVAVSDVVLPRGLPAPRTVSALSAVTDAAPILLERRVVTAGTDRLGDRLKVADRTGGADVTVKPVEKLPMPVVAGDIVTVAGTLKKTAHGREIAAARIQVVGCLPR